MAAILERVPVSGVTGGGQGGRVPPRDFWPGNFCWRIGKKEARKKGKRSENWEEKVENWKWKQEHVRKRGEDLFFFFFFFFCFSLLKTMKICFGSTKMGIFYREKAFHAGKKIWKNDFAPSEKYACYAPGPCMMTKCYINFWLHSFRSVYECFPSTSCYLIFQSRFISVVLLNLISILKSSEFSEFHVQ